MLPGLHEAVHWFPQQTEAAWSAAKAHAVNMVTMRRANIWSFMMDKQVGGYEGSGGWLWDLGNLQLNIGNLLLLYSFLFLPARRWGCLKHTATAPNTNMI